MRRNVAVRVACLVIAAVVLCGAVAYAAFLGSPYETLKTAVLDAITYRNSTVQGQVTFSVDGVVQQTNKVHFVNGDNSSLNYYFDEDGNPDGYYYQNSEMTITDSSYMEFDGEKWYSAYLRSVDDYYNSLANNGFGLSQEDRDSARFRFMELLLDALVGDLKNNVTMSLVDGSNMISASLTESQVPEIARAGIDAMIESSGRYYFEQRDVSFDGSVYVYERVYVDNGIKTVNTFSQAVRPITAEEEQALEDGSIYNASFYGISVIDDVRYMNEGPEMRVGEYTAPATRADFADVNPLQIPMKSLSISYVHGDAMVDPDGNLLSVDVNGSATITNIFGDILALDVNANLNITDIGTSNPVCPIPDAEQLLTLEYIRNRFDDKFMNYVNVFFTLNPDGTIDADSITTTHPSENREATSVTVVKGISATASGSAITVGPCYGTEVWDGEV